MSQLPLFSLAPNIDPASAEGRGPEADTERLLAAFRDARLAQGASQPSVRREVSQLRAVMREAGSVDPLVTLRTLVADPALIAQALREPRTPIARTTGRARLRAVQRFIGLMGRTLGRDPAAGLTTLDVLLPARRSAGWHTTGTLVAGTPGRRRRRGPSLDAADLRRIVDATGMTASPYAQRDRALVALHCFTGLRPQGDRPAPLGGSGHRVDGERALWTDGHRRAQRPARQAAVARAGLGHSRGAGPRERWHR